MSELAEPRKQVDHEVGAADRLRSVASRFARASAVYGFANFSVRSINFLLIPLYAHYLSPSDYGTIYLAETVAIFALLFGNLSIDTAIQRLYFQHHLDRYELNSFIGTSIRFGFGSIVLSVAAVYLAGQSLQGSLPCVITISFYPYIALALFTAALTQGVQYQMAVFQAERRPRAYAILSILLFVSTACCCVYAVAVRHDGAAGMLSGKLVASFAVFMIAVWSMRRFFLAPFQWKFARETLTFSLPLVPHQAMAGGLIVADRFILAHYRDVNEVGIYSLAYSLGMVMLLITQSVLQAWLPMFFDLARGREENRRILGRMSAGFLIILVAIACVGIYIAPQFVHLTLGYRYRAAGQIIPLVIAGYLFHAFFSLFNLSIMQAKRTGYVFAVSSLACSVNVLLNFVLIPRWGMHGAAWATLIAYAIEALCTFAIAQIFFALSYKLKEVVLSLAVCGSALWFSQTSWSLAQHWWLVLSALVVSMALLGLIGRKDAWAVFDTIRRYVGKVIDERG
jgi:O-antigen/teichoic acid export membrane protein